jgi:hypothetical protein
MLKSGKILARLAVIIAVFASFGSLLSTPRTFASTTILEETFEGAFPWGAQTGDWESTSGPDYWGATGHRSHGGSSSSWCAQVGGQSPTTVWTEDFDVYSFPGTDWTVGDQNSNSGLDFWGETSERNSHSGDWSTWCAEIGVQSSSVTVWTEDFEGSFPASWVVDDTNTNSGLDYWSDTSYKSHNGGWSGWCAKVGDQHDTGQSNIDAHRYDDDMDAYMYRSASLSSYSSATLTYWYWLECEANYDYLQVMYNSGGSWHYVDIHTGWSGGWQQSTVSIPSSATQVGFRFYSDETNNIRQGAYIDDVTLTGIGNPNESLRQYDNDQNSYMYWSVSLSGYSSATLSYWYWLDCESEYDYLQAMYYSGGTWNYIDTRSGNSNGWQQSTVSIPSSATQVGFRFYSDEIVCNYEGAYIDDMLLFVPTTVDLRLSDFNTAFATNNVRVVYPSNDYPKPLGCGAAMVSDWTASAFVTTKLQAYTEGLDTDSNFVNQASGKPQGASGIGVVTFGGWGVNPVVKYAESSGTPSSDRAPVKTSIVGNTVYFQHSDGSNIPNAEISFSVLNQQDMFVIEVYKDGDGRNMMICYGVGWKGTYAAGKYFHATIYPNLSSYNNVRWIIVKWQDGNGDLFVNEPGDGDDYTVIASGP